MYIALIKAKDKIYILANYDYSVATFRTECGGVNFFEKTYNDNHDRGYEASMSACLHGMFIHLSMVAK